MSSISSAFQHILAIVESKLEMKRQGCAGAGEQSASEDAIEMAKTLCALSEGFEQHNNGRGGGGNIQGNEQIDVEGDDAGENKSGSMNDNGIKEENESFSFNQPISIQIHDIPTSTSGSTSDPSSGQKIYKGVNFSSFADFEAAFEEWKQIYHHPFRVASSEKHEDRQLAERFKYRYVVYHCSRYGEPRKRGAGRRPHQNYLPCGCNAKLRLNYHAQNDGSLQVTTLETQHNHEPMVDEDGNGYIGGGSAKKRKSSPVEDSFGEEPSPNSVTSAPIAAPQFSPLSLHPAMHHSPSSGGQSSSEGVNETLGLSILGLVSPPIKMEHKHRPNVANRSQMLQTHAASQNRQHVQQKQNPLISPLATNPGSLDAYLAQILQWQQQQQESSSSSTTTNINHNMSSSSASASSTASILSAALLHQLQQHHQTTTQPSSSSSSSSQKMPIPFKSEIKSEHHHQQQQQLSAPSNPSSNSNNNSLLSLLQLQFLINSTKSSQQQPSQGPSKGGISPASNAQLLQLLAGGQQTRQRGFGNHSVGTSSGNNMMMTAAATMLRNNSNQHNHHNFGPVEQQLEAVNRGEMIKEADLLLQMMVSQIIRTRDLNAYLRRLRQFLAENFD